VEQLIVFLHPEEETQTANSFEKKQKQTETSYKFPSYIVLRPTSGMGGKWSKNSMHCNVTKDLLLDE